VGIWQEADNLVKWNPNSLLNAPGNWNPMVYAANDPVNFVDPSGNAGIGVGGGFSITLGPLRFDGGLDVRVIRDSTKSVFDLSSYSAGLHYTSPSITAFGDKTLGGYRSGVAGFHIDTGINLKISNADNISQIKGTAFSSGFNLGKGIDLGFEITSSIRSKHGELKRNNVGNPISEMSFSIGGGIGAEAHIATENRNRDLININAQ
jgi:hypothetical protein